MNRPLLTAALTLPAVLLLTGCNIIKAAAYYLHPPRIAKAEYKITSGKLAVVVDPSRPDEAQPVFEQALQEKLQELFLEKKSSVEFIPYVEVITLRQKQADFAKWPIQRIGHELGANYVLYLRQDSLTARSSRSEPIVQASVAFRAKLIDVSKPAEQARVWPPEKDGRVISTSRQPQDASQPDIVDLELTKLGKDVAYFVMAPFFDTDEEEKPPVEK